MVKNNSSVEYSKESNDLLIGIKWYLKIEHKDDDNELLDIYENKSAYRDKSTKTLLV
jgi:hypothetical protein